MTRIYDSVKMHHHIQQQKKPTATCFHKSHKVRHLLKNVLPSRKLQGPETQIRNTRLQPSPGPVISQGPAGPQ